MFLSAILAVIQILFFAIIFYIILRLLRHTPGIYAFGSLFFIIFLLSLLAYFCNLDVITRVTSFFLRWILPVAFVIIFQQDFRRWLLFLPTLSNNRRALLLWRRSIQKKRRNINGAIYELVNAVCSLSARPEWRNYLLHASNPSPVPGIRLPMTHTGALIALTGQHGLREYSEQGEELSSDINCLLLRSIFNHESPLHDGGVIISKLRIVAAGCRFPPSLQGRLEPVHTRHNAALGLAEVTDAMVIVVSEESGVVSVAENSVITKMDNPQKLIKTLKKHFGIDSEEEAENEKLPSFPERLITYIANWLGASL
jgi:diadenylate cyclase